MGVITTIKETQIQYIKDGARVYHKLLQVTLSQYSSSCGSQMCVDSEMKIAKCFSTVHVSRTATFCRVPLFFFGAKQKLFFFTEAIYEGTCDLHLRFCQKGKLASLV